MFTKNSTDKEINDYVLSVPLEDTAFVIGSGPSLKGVDMSLLKGLNTIGMNRQYISYKEWGFYPKHYFCIDRRLVKAITTRDPKHMDFSETIYPYMIENPECTTESYCFKTDKGGLDATWDAKCDPYHLWNLNYAAELQLVDKEGYSCVAERVPFTGNCGAFATMASFIYGYKRVILLGINGIYAGRDRSVDKGKDLDHYNPDYFDVNKFHEGKHQGPSDHTSGYIYWETLSKFGKSKDADPSILFGWENRYHLDIISCSPDSLINYEYFPYIDLQNYLKIHGK